MQWALFLMGLAAYILVLFWFPETLDPEVAREKFRAAGGVEGRRFVWLNPVKSLALLQSPNILIVVSGAARLFWRFLKCLRAERLSLGQRRS